MVCDNRGGEENVSNNMHCNFLTNSKMTVKKVKEIDVNSSCAHKTARHKSFIQLKNLPMSQKSGKCSEKQPILFIWEYGIVLPQVPTNTMFNEL